MTQYDPSKLTRMERETLNAINALRSDKERDIAPDEVMGHMEVRMGLVIPKTGWSLTLTRMKSIIMKLGDDAPISVAYQRGRGHGANFKLKPKEH